MGAADVRGQEALPVPETEFDELLQYSLLMGGGSLTYLTRQGRARCTCGGFRGREGVGISTDRRTVPRWRRDGKELFYFPEGS